MLYRPINIDMNHYLAYAWFLVDTCTVDEVCVCCYRVCGVVPSPGHCGKVGVKETQIVVYAVIEVT